MTPDPSTPDHYLLKFRPLTHHASSSNLAFASLHDMKLELVLRPKYGSKYGSTHGAITNDDRRTGEHKFNLTFRVKRDEAKP